MERFAEKYLNTWYQNKHRKALVIRGARQVGKSTLVRQFAKKKQLSLLEINLEQYPSRTIWESMRSDIIKKEIELITEKRIKKNSLLFIDEIQACPIAIQALRFLVEEETDLAIIAAGSLLEFVLGEEGFSMPVGRISYFHLGPMTFREVLLAKGNEILEENLRAFNFETSWAVAANQKLKENYMDYLFTGGMPEAVKASIDEKSVLAARDIQRSIVATYQDDFGKYKTKVSTELVKTSFNYVPLHLGEKIKYVNILRDVPSKLLRESIRALVMAKIVLPAYHSTCAGLPLKSCMDSSIYKLYFLDVGLAVYMSGLEWDDLKSNDTMLINKGNISEQFIAQHLAFYHQGLEPPELFYWLREGKSNNAEVDFVLSHLGKMILIEVKAGASGKLRSLHQLVKKTNVARAFRFDMNPPSIQDVSTIIQSKESSKDITFKLYSFPAYMIETFLEVISS